MQGVGIGAEENHTRTYRIRAKKLIHIVYGIG
jgi:hypothetical protein